MKNTDMAVQGRAGQDNIVEHYMCSRIEYVEQDNIVEHGIIE